MSNSIIYCYGNAEVVQSILNAIAMLIQGADGSLVQSMIRLGGVSGALLGTLMYLNQPLDFLKKWFLPTLAIIQLLFAPTSTVMIKDVLTNAVYSVDRIPMGLAFFASLSSQIGHKLTTDFEKIFAGADDLKYTKTGHLFAASLMQKLNTVQIQDPGLQWNMRGFVAQCVAFDVLLGKYTGNDLLYSTDLWGLISKNPSEARSFPYKEGKSVSIITCKEGCAKLGPLLKGTTQTMLKKETIKNLPLALDALIKKSKNAESRMMQELMMTSVVDGVEHKKTMLGAAPDFAARRAFLTQQKSFDTAGSLAGEFLPIAKNVFEILVYVGFIFMMPLMLFPNGFQVIRSWLMLVVWVQLWPPLYAVLNLIVNAYTTSRLGGVLGGQDDISIGTWVGFQNLAQESASLAGYLALSIPMIAWGFVQGGLSAFSNIAGQMMSMAGSSATQAANEEVSGNYSFGNVSNGGVQAWNTSMGQNHRSFSYGNGSYTTNDGLVQQTTDANGEQILRQESSNLRSNVTMGENISQHFSEQAQESAHVAEQKSVSAQEMTNNAYNNTLQLGKTLSQSTQFGKNHTDSTSLNDNQALHRAVSNVKEFAKLNDMSYVKSAELMAGVSAGYGFDVLVAKGSFNTEGAYRSSATSKEDYLKAQKFAEDHNMAQDLQKASAAVAEKRGTLHDETGKNLSENVHHSLEKARQDRDEASKSWQESQNFTLMATASKSTDGQIQRNLNQEYKQWLADRPQTVNGTTGRLGESSAKYIMLQDPELNAAYQRQFLGERMHNMDNHIKKMPLQSLDQAKDVYQQMNNPTVSSRGIPGRQEVQNKSYEAGFTPGYEDRVKNELQNVQSHVEEKIVHGENKLVNEDMKINTDYQNHQQKVNNEQGDPLWKGGGRIAKNVGELWDGAKSLMKEPPKKPQTTDMSHDDLLPPPRKKID